RQWSSLIRERAVGAGDVSDLRLRQRCAKRNLAARHGKGGQDWMLRVDRVRLRLNPSGMRICAIRSGSDYVLNGEKMWITSGSIADVAVVWAKSEEHNNRIRGFLVETNRPGFKADDVHGKWSLRASVTSGLSLQDVRIPGENLLPGSDGLKSPLSCLNQARYGIGWGAIGAAMSCYDTALQYSQVRKQFRDQPIASHQLVQEKLAWMISEITKAQLLALQVGRLKDAGKVGHQHISMAKRNNVWMALECARMARDILGANGI